MTNVLLTAKILPDDPNPFVSLYAKSIPSGTQIAPFAWPTALTGRYDVVHAQWVEYIFRGSTLPKAAVKYALARTWLLRLSRRRTPIIETVHNLNPHEGGNFFEKRLFAVWNSLPKFRVYLNEATDNPMEQGAVILHGMYETPTAGPATAARVACVGQIRPYKGVETLIAATSGIRDARVSVVIAGSCPDEELRASLTRMAASIPALSMRFGFLSDAEIEAVLRDSSVVALPYRAVYNSGVAILALGLKRPILVPESTSTLALQHEFGAHWVRLYSGDITADHLEEAALSSNPSETDEERWQAAAANRSWPAAGELYARLFDLIREHSDPHLVREKIEQDADFCVHSALNRASSKVLS